MTEEKDKRERNKRDGEKRNNSPKRDNVDEGRGDSFIMLPTVDFCFKELMKNPKVRKGFVAAILGKSPETVRRTTVIETELRRESEDDKLGILDVLVELEDGTRMNMEMQVPYHFPQDHRCYRRITLCDAETGEQYTDLMELHVLELKKLPPEDQNENGVIRWMRFLGGKNRKEFEDMAEKDEYIKEAYEDLKKLSLDGQKRLEYEVRQKAIRDHNSQMKSAERRGEKRGIEIGEKRGKQLALKELVHKKIEAGKSLEEIAEFMELDLSEVRKLMEE